MTEEKQPYHPKALCHQCPLFPLDTYVPSSLGDNGFAIVGEAPGLEDVEQRTPFVGRPGRKLMELIRTAGVGENLRPATVTNCVSCRPTRNPRENLKPPAAAIAACNPRLMDELKDVHTVVALGATTTSALMPEPESISSARLGPMKDIDGRKVLFTWHPAYALRQPRAGNDIVSDLKKLNENAVPWQEPKVEIAWNVPDAIKWLNHFLSRTGPMAGDIETANTPERYAQHEFIPIPKPDRFRCIGLCDEPNLGVILAEEPLKNPEVKALLELLMRKRRINWHNGKFDHQAMEHMGWIVPALGGDTFLGSYALNEWTQSRKGLEDVSRNLLGSPEWKWTKAIDKKLPSLRESMVAIRMGLESTYTQVQDLLSYEDFLENTNPITPWKKELGNEGYTRLKSAVTVMRKRRTALDRATELIESGYDIVKDVMSRGEYVQMVDKGYGNVYDDAPERALYMYCAFDTVDTFRIAKIIEARIEQEGQSNLYFNHFLPASDALMHTEARGIELDFSAVDEINASFQAQTTALLDVLTQYVEKPGSNEQIKSYLAGQGIHLEDAKADTLRELVAKDICVDFLSPLLEYKKVSKLYSTYVKPLYRLRYNGRVHPTYKMTGTETGRLSAAGPNIQNQPKEMRKLYVPARGKIFVQGDLKSAEYRVITILSQDPAALEMYRNNEDIHTTTAMLVFGDQVKEHLLLPHDDPRFEEAYKQRRSAKAIVFGIPYGRGAAAIAKDWQNRQAGMTIGLAEDIYNAFFGRFSRIQAWQNEIYDQVIRGETLQTPFGRKLRLPKPGRDASRGEINSLWRQGLAFKPQSTASDITLTALTKLDQQGWPVVATVHDSILLEVEEHLEAEASEALHRELEAAGRQFTTQIPFEVDVASGYRWSDC